jgi:hypothetical protein
MNADIFEYADIIEAKNIRSGAPVIAREVSLAADAAEAERQAPSMIAELQLSDLGGEGNHQK